MTATRNMRCSWASDEDALLIELHKQGLLYTEMVPIFKRLANPYRGVRGYSSIKVRARELGLKGNWNGSTVDQRAKSKRYGELRVSSEKPGAGASRPTPGVRLGQPDQRRREHAGNDGTVNCGGETTEGTGQ